MTPCVPTDEEILDKTREVLQSVSIPSCPRILLEINEAMRDEDVNLAPVADMVARDVGLTARVLKIANSPIFGSRMQIDSVTLALTRLGIRNFRSAVMAGGLRECIGDSVPGLERFWSHSETVAGLCQRLAQSLCPALVESSYLAGLFHDCGIPLMLRRFPHYSPYVELALSHDSGVPAIEEGAFGVHHADAGFLMARTWYLPDAVSSSVREHHVTPTFSLASADCRRLVALVQLAERVELKAAHQKHALFAESEETIRVQIFTTLDLKPSTCSEVVKGVLSWLRSQK